MRQNSPNAPGVLAIYPTTRGFGYAVFEGPASLVDWGIRHILPRRKREHLIKVRALIEYYRPDTIVVPSTAGDRDIAPLRPRRQRVRRIARLAKLRGLPMASYSRAQIRVCFARFQARTKDEIARVIAREFLELAPRVPKKRRAWTSEDARMGIFDAAALALTHLYFESALVADDEEEANNDV